MLPIHNTNLCISLPSQSLTDLNRSSPSVIPSHVNLQHNSEKKDRRARAKIETISDWIIWSIEGQKAPCRDQSSNVTKHDVQANS
jgi:hypothetical protein